MKPDAYFEFDEPWPDLPDRHSHWRVELTKRAPLGEPGYLVRATNGTVHCGDITDEEDLIVLIELVKHFIRNRHLSTEMPTRELISVAP